MIRKPFLFLVHVALAIILAGAIVTHFWGIQGELAVAEGEGTRSFKKTSGPGDGTFPFTVELVSTEISYYPGTTAPMDFRSNLLIDGEPFDVSMNNVAKIDGWRFFQSGISSGSSRLTVSHDPWGTGITYVGYALLFIAMAGFFFQKNTCWRALLRKGSKVVPVLLLFMGANAKAGEVEGSGKVLPAMQRPLAANFGKVHVYWNDRVCPLQTMAKDVTLKLYGSTSYKGMSAEQVLSGWLFWFDAWERDYLSGNAQEPKGEKARKKYNERKALIHWLGTGEAFRIYPYRAADGNMTWLSLTGRRPSKMELEQWIFMQNTMPEIKKLLLEGRNIAANDRISGLITEQAEYAGRENLPSEAKMKAEMVYNRYASLLYPVILALLLGIFSLSVAVKGIVLSPKGLAITNNLHILLFAYLLATLVLLWMISGHVPLSNGPEMMLFMSLLAVLCPFFCRNRMVKGSFLVVAAMTLFVGVMGGRSPRIGMLMPVLASPLLSVHVMLVMTSYVFFMIMAVLSAIGLISKDKDTADSLCRINRLILTPAVFLLAAGMFVGAIWANQSWGRYWGWDPKETCALVMLLIYSVPMHWGTRLLKVFRKPKVLHWYLLLAILSVAFTYFGANYLLPGLHSYA